MPSWSVMTEEFRLAAEHAPIHIVGRVRGTNAAGRRSEMCDIWIKAKRSSHTAHGFIFGTMSFRHLPQPFSGSCSIRREGPDCADRRSQPGGSGLATCGFREPGTAITPVG